MTRPKSYVYDQLGSKTYTDIPQTPETANGTGFPKT